MCGGMRPLASLAGVVVALIFCVRMIRVYIEVSALELRGVHHHLFKQFSYRDNPLSLLQFLAKNAATGRSIRSGAVTN